MVEHIHRLPGASLCGRPYAKLLLGGRTTPIESRSFVSETIPCPLLVPIGQKPLLR